MTNFDYVIVGGGTAGCVLAARLTEDPAVKVLLLEAGGEANGFWVNIPAGFGKMLTSDKFNWRFHSEPEDGTCNRKIVVPRGKGLGGSTLINGMIYVRGQEQDFDTWGQMGNRGWNAAKAREIFRKIENYAQGDRERGHGGPFEITEVALRPRLADAFISAAETAGFSRNPDYNSSHQDGFGYYQVNQKNGRRWHTGKAYLAPARKRPNLSVLTGAHVTRLLLEGKAVRGVEYSNNGALRSVRSREVILAAGAVQSPQILELSGIGDPDVLAAAGITAEHALPGVGANYADHYCTRMNWRVNQPITLNEQTRGLGLVTAVAKYFLTGKGILSLGTGLAYGFIRTRPDLEVPDVQYFFMHASYANAADRRLDHKPGVTIGVTQLRPELRGTIHVGSSDPFAAPVIRPNFLSVPNDARVIIDGMKIARRIMDEAPMRQFLDHEMNPGTDVQSDAQWLQFTRSNGQTIYHPVGTCKMGSDPMAVVDDRLRVHGLQGLRVIDASIMPSQVSGNTMAAVLMIAEHGAEILKEDRKSA